MILFRLINEMKISACWQKLSYSRLVLRRSHKHWRVGWTWHLLSSVCPVLWVSTGSTPTYIFTLSA